MARILFAAGLYTTGPRLSSRKLKKFAGVVLASLRPSTYPLGYAFGPSLAAALLTTFLSILRTYFSSRHFYDGPMTASPTGLPCSIKTRRPSTRRRPSANSCTALG